MGSDASVTQPQRLIIRPSRGWVAINFGELWAYRELLFFLTWRDIKVRYKQTALGALWAVLQPVLTMVVFSVFFGRLAKMPSDGVPYPLFALSGLLPWQLFAYALTQSSNSLVANKNLITKVYFPRLIVPLASVLGGLVDFAIAFAVLLGADALLRHRPGPRARRAPVRGAARRRHGAGGRTLAVGAERPVPRRAVHDPVPDASSGCS